MYWCPSVNTVITNLVFKGILDGYKKSPTVKKKDLLKLFHYRINSFNKFMY